eukprot:1200228-Pyramimonas_sp.AAC.1
MYSAKATANLPCTRVSSAHATATSVLSTVRPARARCSDQSTGFVRGPGGGSAGSLDETEKT